MEHTLMVGAPAAVLAALWLVSLVIVERCVRIYRRSRAPQVIRCPNRNAPAALEVALGSPLRVQRCSRWPEQAQCMQGCLAQIAAMCETEGGNLKRLEQMTGVQVPTFSHPTRCGSA